MEAPDYFHGGYFHAAIAQYSPEKKAAGAGERDQFFVEDLLDFSNEEQEEDEAAAGALVSGDEGGLDAAAWNSTDESTESAVDSCSNSLSGGDAYVPGDVLCCSFADTTLSGGICEPHYDEIAELEWLSNFVDDSSFSGDDLHKLHVNSAVPYTADASSLSSASSFNAAASSVVPSGDASQLLIFRPEAPIPGKARGKRSRAAPCRWASRVPVLPSSINNTSSPESELFARPSHAVKKAAKPTKENGPSARAASGPTWDRRKCHHCHTDKTPQWRTGPMGPKTLCNACGVRYKSGRLVPEYRPAASPTFVLSKHSNSHRKVLELRRQKEIILQRQQQLLGSAGGGGGGCKLYDTPPSMAVADFSIRHVFGADFRQLI